MSGKEEIERLRAELAHAHAEIKELKTAVVAMCDVYSANRSEKRRVKAFRRHAADPNVPFSLASVTKTFERLEEVGESDRPHHV